MDFNTIGGVGPATFATWQSSTGGDANSSAGNPGGNFTMAMFVDAANGDLHLVPGGNPLVSIRGTPVGGVTTDYDGEHAPVWSPPTSVRMNSSPPMPI